MSLAEIEKAVDALSPEELAKLAEYIARHDKLAWDEEIERDFSPGGKHAASLEMIDAESTPGISNRCRDITRAPVFLEMLPFQVALL